MSPLELFQSGLEHKAAGDFPVALDLLAEATDAFGQHEDARATCSALAEAADCHRMLEAFRDALRLIKTALQIAQSISRPESICRVKMIHGQVLEDQYKRLEAYSPRARG